MSGKTGVVRPKALQPPCRPKIIAASGNAHEELGRAFGLASIRNVHSTHGRLGTAETSDVSSAVEQILRTIRVEYAVSEWTRG